MRHEAKPILIVEDDPDDRFLIQRAFQKSKLTNPLRLVGDGDEALAYLLGEGAFADRNINPDPAVVLLDLKLPRRSGLEVLEWIRGRPAPIGHLPVVVLTSSRESSDLQRAYDLGANSYLVKPVDFDGLLNMVATVGLYWTVMNEVPERG